MFGTENLIRSQSLICFIFGKAKDSFSVVLIVNGTLLTILTPVVPLVLGIIMHGLPAVILLFVEALAIFV
ncbi:MAG: hypothetical protein ACXW0I_06415 [Methylosarcina sp.]